MDVEMPSAEYLDGSGKGNHDQKTLNEKYIQ